ncbi:helix-turn-helix domain-containing protein [Bradyrhizobium jicamae]|uniref:Helix-turn-helix domain-containing protein n=1 Tax=Bradyrhizobium jicamae TaxID=280332 RepID=A0ABS5FKD1_9BRAD|nr:helix-turn-helix domain-containing protein [Bradyrhizobium jicamae]MBR0938260.1 helix-turn-helix domain-containing protein [Bradyrhizobium jicamae]
MGRRAEKLIALERHEGGVDNLGVIRVVSRAFDILRCFEGPGVSLGNREIADRCRLPRSTVSRLVMTLTQIGQLAYLPQEQKYALGPHAIALGTPRLAESCDQAPLAGEQQLHRSPRIDVVGDGLAL